MDLRLVLNTDITKYMCFARAKAKNVNDLNILTNMDF